MKDQKSNYFVQPGTLVVGTDKWHLENMVNSDFLWMGFPFDNSRAKGFISPGKDLTIKTPFPILVDLEECTEIDLLGFDHKNCIFFSEKWMCTASKVASIIKNITFFKDDRQFTIKREYEILGRNEK